MPPRGDARSERSLRGGGRARWEQPPAGSASSTVVASLKTNKGEDAEAGKPEMGKAVAIKESERFGEEERAECQTEKPGEEFNAVRAAIKEYDRYKSL